MAWVKSHDSDYVEGSSAGDAATAWSDGPRVRRVARPVAEHQCQ